MLAEMSGEKQETDNGFRTPARMVGKNLCLTKSRLVNFLVVTRKVIEHCCKFTREIIRIRGRSSFRVHEGLRMKWSELLPLLFICLIYESSAFCSNFSNLNSAKAAELNLQKNNKNFVQFDKRAQSDKYAEEHDKQALEAARGLESMLVDMMVQEMRKSVPENELVPLSQSERIFQQMLDNEYSRKISESGTLGIAEQIVAHMKGQR
jgi:hypothetical protein